MIKKFQRDFAVKSLDGHFNNSRSLIGALLDRWVLPGEPGRGGEPPLRLAVRDGYFNLYADGQSVAKISSPKNGPRLEVHWKYLETFPISEPRGPGNKTYVRFEGDKLVSHTAREAVDQWIRTARKYAGNEKRFVEHLVARNPNVIDLEMGLPGDPRFKSHNDHGKVGLSAPRMDLVVVHLGNGASIINFWEAKLANNPELRATLPDHGGLQRPHVCNQIDNYAMWLGIEGRLAEVKAAYRNSAGISGDLADRVGKAGEAREVWRALAMSEPDVNLRAGIIVGNYHPDEPHNRFPQAVSFETKGHRKRLRELEYRLREVEGVACKNGVICEALPEGAN